MSVYDYFRNSLLGDLIILLEGKVRRTCDGPVPLPRQGYGRRALSGYFSTSELGPKIFLVRRPVPPTTFGQDRFPRGRSDGPSVVRRPPITPLARPHPTLRSTPLPPTSRVGLVRVCVPRDRRTGDGTVTLIGGVITLRLQSGNTAGDRRPSCRLLGKGRRGE